MEFSASGVLLLVTRLQVAQSEGAARGERKRSRITNGVKRIGVGEGIRGGEGGGVAKVKNTEVLFEK